MECVRLKASVAHSDEAVAAFEHGESALDGASDAADKFVAHALPVRQLLLAAGPSMPARRQSRIVSRNLHYWTWGAIIKKLGRFRCVGSGGSEMYHNIDGKFDNIIIIYFTATAATHAHIAGKPRISATRPKLKPALSG